MRRPVLIAVALCTAFCSACFAAATPEQMIASGSVDDAIKQLSGKNDAASLNLLSRAYYAIEQWDNAIPAGEKAVSQNPNDSMFHLWLGREYGQKAANVNALSAASYAKKTKNEFEQAVQLDPSNLQARADLAEYYTDAPSIMGGGLDKARDQAAQVAKFNEAASHWMLADIAAKEKNYSEAEDQLQKAVVLSRNPARYWMSIASLDRRRSRYDEMQKAIAQAVSQPFKAPETYFDAASELFQAGKNLPDAVQYLTRYLNSGAMVEDAPAFRAHYLLGQIYEKMGNKADAASEYKASLALASGFAPASNALGRVQ